ncbi:MAG: hypothetical protein K0S41_835 [Anaerocolumna sp.]|jgi:cell wall-associated NlpC family hydrolase|nr:hypothetical protein [Anaerocolumna sp.]
MTKHIRRISTYCLIGFLAFTSKSIVANAAEIPLAGIDVVLNDFYRNKPNTVTDITEYLIDSEYKDLAIAQVTNYVNIRSKADEESEILGKLYNNSAAKVLKKEGGWYKIESGSVTGYVNADFLVTGDSVIELAKKVGKRIATVNTTTLKVRDNPSLDASVQTLVPIEEELSVKKELDGWIKISIDSDVDGYVSADYVDLTTEYETAISIEEEIAQIEAEAEAAEATRRAEEAEANRLSGLNRANTTVNEITTTNSNVSSIREKIVNYALRFVGNPYVWGGTSLTNGADCSGYTQSIFRDNGIYIPRTSREQASGGGRVISINNMKPGDLIFYDKAGTINHVAIYIGNGKVVAASSPETGIKISNYNYRQPYKVVNYID